MSIVNIGLTKNPNCYNDADHWWEKCCAVERVTYAFKSRPTLLLDGKFSHHRRYLIAQFFYYPRIMSVAYSSRSAVAVPMLTLFKLAFNWIKKEMWMNESRWSVAHVYLLLSRGGRRDQRNRNTVPLLPQKLIWCQESLECATSDWMVHPFPFHQLLRIHCVRNKFLITIQVWLESSIYLEHELSVSDW